VSNQAEQTSNQSPQETNQSENGVFQCNGGLLHRRCRNAGIGGGESIVNSVEDCYNRCANTPSCAEFGVVEVMG